MTQYTGSMEFKSTDHAAGYLGAIIDGEGCVTFKVTPTATGRKLRRSVRIANTSPEIIEATQQAAAMLGIKTSVHQGWTSNAESWVVFIGGSELAKLRAAVVLADPGKAERLQQGAAIEARPRRTRP